MREYHSLQFVAQSFFIPPPPRDLPEAASRDNKSAEMDKEVNLTNYNGFH